MTDPIAPPVSSIIRLSGPFSVASDLCGKVDVVSIAIQREDYCCDVSVHVKNGRHELAADETFLAGVNQALRGLGYEGPALGRAEWGAQGSKCIVLEATSAFQAFAVSKGWRYADGQDAWEADQLLRTLPANSMVSFTASNGAVYGVSVSCIAEMHAEAHAEAAGGFAPALKTLTLPALKARPEVAAQWLREVLSWEQASSVMREIKAPPELDMKREFDVATLHTKGMGAGKWRDAAGD